MMMEASGVRVRGDLKQFIFMSLKLMQCLCVLPLTVSLKFHTFDGVISRPSTIKEIYFPSELKMGFIERSTTARVPSRLTISPV